jgi:hypothetical protein
VHPNSWDARADTEMYKGLLQGLRQQQQQQHGVVYSREQLVDALRQASTGSCQSTTRGLSLQRCAVKLSQAVMASLR